MNFEFTGWLKIQNSQYHIATNLTLYVDLLYVYIYTVFLIHLSLFTAIVNKTSDSQFMHKRIKDRQLQLCILIYIYTYIYMYIHIVSNYINV